MSFYGVPRAPTLVWCLSPEDRTVAYHRPSDPVLPQGRGHCFSEVGVGVGTPPIIGFVVTPGLIACSALSFLLSFDETVISLFLSGPRATLPVEMVRYVEGRTDPLIAALSVL